MTGQTNLQAARVVWRDALMGDDSAAYLQARRRYMLAVRQAEKWLMQLARARRQHV